MGKGSETFMEERELQRLFELSLDLLCVAGTDGYFVEVNPAFERVLGYSREELLSRAFVEFVHPDDRERTLAAVERLVEGRQVVDFENRYRTKDGSWRWLEWRSTPLTERGRIYAVARDVTEQKRVEELMQRQAEELARSNADLEQFAYVASHDLQAPLRVIGNLAEWIEEELPDGTPDSLREKLERLRGRVQLMERLTEDLLHYSRVGREREQVEQVDTARLVEEVVFLLSPPSGMEVEIAAGMPVLETSRAPLQQVFRNLVDNAVSHHDRAAGHVVISADDRDDVWEFAVADDGPGISSEHHDSIFQMFEQLDRDGAEGTGIGLALVKRIVEIHGGGVRVESGDGRGTTFRFTWPKRPRS